MDIKIQKKHIFTSLAIIFTFLILAEMSFQYYKIKSLETEQGKIKRYAQSSAQLIQENLIRKIYAVDTLKVILELSDFKLELFNEWAPNIYNTVPGIASIQIAPDGIVKYIYPLEGNEGAIGHDLLKDKNRDDGARKAIESEDIIFVGPITLIQNGKKAVIGRKPIFVYEDKIKKFWGFSIVLIYVEDLDITNILSNDNYLYEISGYNPDSDKKPIIYSNFTEGSFELYSNTITIPDGEWKLTFYKKDNSINNRVHILFYLISIILSLIVAWINHKRYSSKLHIINLNKQLRELSLRDELTKCYNRRFFDSAILQEINRSKRYHENLSFILIDIDFFKKVNDKQGHNIGDLILVEFSKLVRNKLRKADTLVRWGGEEFFIILPQTNKNQAAIVAELLRKLVEENHFSFDLDITASFGVTAYIKEENYDEIFLRIDRALYEAKLKGRNQVVVL